MCFRARFWLGRREEVFDRGCFSQARGRPVSICFCARRSEIAAEAGVETAQSYRGKGYAVRVTAAWAIAIRNSGKIPLYSTSLDEPRLSHSSSEIKSCTLREFVELL